MRLLIAPSELMPIGVADFLIISGALKLVDNLMSNDSPSDDENERLDLFSKHRMLQLRAQRPRRTSENFTTFQNRRQSPDSDHPLSCKNIGQLVRFSKKSLNLASAWNNNATLFLPGVHNAVL